MPYTYDIIILFLGFIFIFSGFKRGFTRSVISFLGGLLVVVSAALLSSFLSQLIFDTFIRENITKDIYSTINNTVGQDIITRTTAILDSFPKFISNTLYYYNITPHSVDLGLNNTIDAAANQSVGLVAPIIINLIRIILFALLTTFGLFLLRFISRAIGRITRLPVLKQVDHLLGGVFGLLKCLLLIFVACIIIYFITPYLGETPKYLTKEFINDTYLFKYFYYSNPVNSILNIV